MIEMFFFCVERRVMWSCLFLFFKVFYFVFLLVRRFFIILICEVRLDILSFYFFFVCENFFIKSCKVFNFFFVWKVFEVVMFKYFLSDLYLKSSFFFLVIYLILCCWWELCVFSVFFSFNLSCVRVLFVFLSIIFFFFIRFMSWIVVLLVLCFLIFKFWLI